MEKIRCSMIKDLLPLYVDGVVRDETAREIQSHLDVCEDCCNDYKTLKKELVLPSNPTIQQESGKVLKDFRHQWKMKKIAIACTSVMLTALVMFTGVMVCQNVSIVHDYFFPFITVTLRDIQTDDEWQRVRMDDADVLVFDSIFYSKEAVLHGNSDSAISLRIRDKNGMVVLDESIIQPGTSLDLDMLQRNTEYIVEVKADAGFALITFI